MAEGRTLTVDREVYAALKERAAQEGMSVNTMVARILRQQLGFAQETRSAIREVPGPSLVEAYEAAWMEVDDAGAHDFMTPDGNTKT